MSSICDAITPLQPAGKSYSMFFQLVFYNVLIPYKASTKSQQWNIEKKKNAKNSAIRCHINFCTDETRMWYNRGQTNSYVEHKEETD